MLLIIRVFEKMATEYSQKVITKSRRYIYIYSFTIKIGDNFSLQQNYRTVVIHLFARHGGTSVLC